MQKSRKSSLSEGKLDFSSSSNAQVCIVCSESQILKTVLFSWWFYFREFCESDLAKISTSTHMSINSNENIRKSQN